MVVCTRRLFQKMNMARMKITSSSRLQSEKQITIRVSPKLLREMLRCFKHNVKWKSSFFTALSSSNLKHLLFRYQEKTAHFRFK